MSYNNYNGGGNGCGAQWSQQDDYWNKNGNQQAAQGAQDLPVQQVQGAAHVGPPAQGNMEQANGATLGISPPVNGVNVPRYQLAEELPQHALNSHWVCKCAPALAWPMQQLVCATCGAARDNELPVAIQEANRRRAQEAAQAQGTPYPACEGTIPCTLR